MHFKCRVVVLRHKVIKDKTRQTRQAIALAISAMERETVPDTEDYILLDKIGMGVYSGVYEYTQQIRNKYKVYRVYRYLGIC